VNTVNLLPLTHIADAHRGFASVNLEIFESGKCSLCVLDRNDMSLWNDEGSEDLHFPEIIPEEEEDEPVLRDSLIPNDRVAFRAWYRRAVDTFIKSYWLDTQAHVLE